MSKFPTCRTCPWWGVYPDDIDDYERRPCYRFPHVTWTGYPHGSYRPLTDADFWCGEHPEMTMERLLELRQIASKDPGVWP